MKENVECYMTFQSIMHDVSDGFGSLSRSSFEVRLSGNLKGNLREQCVSYTNCLREI